MVYVALAELAALALVSSVFARLLVSQQRSHARREDLILNQLLHAAGKAWLPAPADELVYVEPAPIVPFEDRFQASPEQHLTI